MFLKYLFFIWVSVAHRSLRRGKSCIHMFNLVWIFIHCIPAHICVHTTTLTFVSSFLWLKRVYFQTWFKQECLFDLCFDSTVCCWSCGPTGIRDTSWWVTVENYLCYIYAVFFVLSKKSIRKTKTKSTILNAGFYKNGFYWQAASLLRAQLHWDTHICVLHVRGLVLCV